MQNCGNILWMKIGLGWPHGLGWVHGLVWFSWSRILSDGLGWSQGLRWLIVSDSLMVSEVAQMVSWSCMVLDDF